ncbi:MAG: UDP-N-acetylmuramate--L-alanine ligase [Thermoleophilia bacterium]|nr:UDP-N-acetylmuramate--L-alanine ligase [Thermoleophilia bacterium]
MTPRAIHLVGAGGAGMSAVGLLALRSGWIVTGTDREEGPGLAALRAAGADVRAGHGADALPAHVDAVFVSTAIPADNPELVAARERGLPTLHRSDLLAELMQGWRGLAVGGAHGKSTTTAMLALALGGATVCVGAEVPWGEGTGAAWGDGPWFCAEADESDRSLLRLTPEAAILLNIDHDHHSTYRSIDEVEDVFRTFVGALPSTGVLVVGSDARARDVARAAPCPVRVVGDTPAAWGWVDGDCLVLATGRRVPLHLAAPGAHNRENAACAIALAEWCGVDAAVAAARIAPFAGVARRFEEIGTVDGVRVVDDYAHHPAEVVATLAAAREVHDGRVVAVFQPHLVSRTRALATEFGAALSSADLVVVTDVYAAREDPEPGVDGLLIVSAVSGPGEVLYVPRLADVPAVLVPDLLPGDLVLTMGAGDITTLGPRLLDALGADDV